MPAIRWSHSIASKSSVMASSTASRPVAARDGLDGPQMRSGLDEEVADGLLVVEHEDARRMAVHTVPMRTGRGGRRRRRGDGGGGGLGRVGMLGGTAEPTGRSGTGTGTVPASTDGPASITAWTGSSITNRLPPLSIGSCHRRPPCAMTMPADTASPRPVPSPGPFVVKNGTNRPASIRLRDATPVVLDPDPDVGSIRGRRGADAQRAVVTRRADRLDGVEREVQEDLLDLRPVERDVRDIGRDVDLDRDPAGGIRIRLEVDDALDEWPDRRGMTFGRSLPREIEQATDDPSRPVGLVDELVGHRLHVRGQARIGAQELAEADDRGEGVVELVGDAGDEQADGLHLLRLDELLLEAFLVRQVADEDQDSLLALDGHRLGQRLARERRTVGPAAEAPPGRAMGRTIGGRAGSLGHRRIGREELVERAAHERGWGQPEQRRGRAVPGQDRSLRGREQVWLRRCLEQRPVADLGGDQMLAQALVVERDGDAAADRLQRPGVDRRGLDEGPKNRAATPRRRPSVRIGKAAYALNPAWCDSSSIDGDTAPSTYGWTKAPSPASNRCQARNSVTRRPTIAGSRSIAPWSAMGT